MKALVVAIFVTLIAVTIPLLEQAQRDEEFIRNCDGIAVQKTGGGNTCLTIANKEE